MQRKSTTTNFKTVFINSRTIIFLSEKKNKLLLAV